MKDISYLILSGKSAFHPSEADLRNQAYAAWYKLWDETYKASGSDYKLTSDEFSRQDLVTVVKVGDQVAALHLYSFFDLQSQSDLSTKYFHFFSEFYLKQLQELKVRSVMSMEFLTVLPEFRKSVVGFSLGSVIAQLGTYVFRESAVDAIVAPARTDLGVHKMAHDIGFVSIEKDTNQRGFNCDLIACLQGHQKPSADLSVHRNASQLWEKRQIFESATDILNPARKIAAMGGLKRAA